MEVGRAEFLRLFAAVFLPMFMAAVDQTLLATATPAIAESLGGLRDASWIASGYLLASATIVPVYGRLGDLRGRREMLLIALGVFTLGSACCGIAQTLPQLVAARIVQGLGGGGLMVLSQSLIGELVAPRERARFQGYFATVFMAASIGGPVVGGIVVSSVSWRWLFLANLPLAAFAAWRISRLPRSTPHVPAGAKSDVPGHVLFAIGAVSALYWFTSVGHRFALASVQSLVIGATAIAALGALVRHERRHVSPFLPIDLMQRPAIRVSVMVVLLWASCLFAVIFFLPVYLQLGHKVSARYSGFLLVPVTVGMMISIVGSAQVLRRTGKPRWIPVSGLSCAAVALLFLGLLPAHLPIIVGFGFLCGLGLGCVMPIIQVTIQTVAGRERLGAVTALAGLARSTGGATGAALFGAAVFALIPRDADLDAIVQAFHYAFLLAALVAGAAAVVASRMPDAALWESATKH